MNPTAPQPSNTPCVLIIRDGWGENPSPSHDPFNAITLANTPVDDHLRATYPMTLVRTSGTAVGLLDGTMGNSEVGHQNLGAGRIVDQDAVRITKACESGDLINNTAITTAINSALATGNAIHLMGIASDAGVHGLLTHLKALLALTKSLSAPPNRVFVHLFTDGRDTGPYTGAAYIQHIQAMCADLGVGAIASVIGRYWAMDRDNRWERVARAYQCLTTTNSPSAPTPDAAIQAHYNNPADPMMVGDEFTPPTAIENPSIPGGIADSRIKSGDAVIFYNYRGDRPRELCAAFLLPEFLNADEVPPSPDTGAKGFDRGEKLDLHFVLMTPYSERLASLASVAFDRPQRMTNTLGEYLSNLSITQFRCAETEKFPHVTFFFNDYRDAPFPGEHRAILQSPKVSTYDQAPEMSARAVADAVLTRLAADDCEPFIIVNFANADMVGHTGKLDAAIKACETVDALTGEIINATLARNGSLIVTADHGNAEMMFNPDTNAPHTAHTTFDVPLFVIGEPFKHATLRTQGVLGDVIPTLLHMTNLPKPPEMTGISLITN